MEKAGEMVVPPFDIARSQLTSEGIYPLTQTYGRERTQIFLLPRNYVRERVLQIIRVYLVEQYEAHTITFWATGNEREVKAKWRE